MRDRKIKTFMWGVIAFWFLGCLVLNQITEMSGAQYPNLNAAGDENPLYNPDLTTWIGVAIVGWTVACLAILYFWRIDEDS